jgi:hypothetical protein
VEVPCEGNKYHIKIKHFKLHSTLKILLTVYCNRHNLYFGHCQLSEDKRSKTVWRLDLDSLQQISYLYCYNFLEQGCTNPRSQVARRINFVPWSLILVGPQCGTCVMSPYWRPEFRGGSQIFGKLVRPWCRV